MICNVGFEQAVQEYAIHVLSLTYQKIPRTILAEVCFAFLWRTYLLYEFFPDWGTIKYK